VIQSRVEAQIQFWFSAGGIHRQTKKRQRIPSQFCRRCIIFMQELHDLAEDGVTLPEFEGWLARQYECR
jgi:hypothetical protein